MADPIIAVENVSKRYRIGVARHDTLRDRIVHAVRAPFQRATPVDRPVDEFWALRDVSFSVSRGEVVGIIGRNGAGKSTLLKILSRITEPTTGRIAIRGRVASLLEVGTGFHPELSGRENIFLNGAILGMTRAEIRRKFDEIVAFAEVERFLDTPVKHYSSGMYVRLAFAVAAHLEPEILVIDEVLAVGDVEFQRKCLGKMRSVATSEGRTVLFVSHNLAAVQALCSKGVYLQNGQVVSQGEIQAQLARYTEAMLAGRAKGGFAPRTAAPGLVLEEFSFDPNPVHSGDAVRFRLALSADRPTTLPDLCILFHSSTGVRVAIADLRQTERIYRIGPDAPLVVEGTIEEFPLVPGDYLAGLYLSSTSFRGDLLDLLTVTVLRGATTTSRTPYPPHDCGYVELNYTFTSGTNAEG